MLLLQSAARRLSRPSTRSFAELVPIQSAQLIPHSSEEAPARRRKRTSKPPVAEKPKGARVPVREDHGLYAFFRRKQDDNLTGEDRYEVLEIPQEGSMVSGICGLFIHRLGSYVCLQGRPWKASELRLKSFKDLHTLWYVAAREQNLLATQKEEVRRLGVSNTDMQVPPDKVRNVRQRFLFEYLVITYVLFSVEKPWRISKQCLMSGA
jgi:large subunit ribosomal protein L47